MGGIVSLLYGTLVYMLFLATFLSCSPASPWSCSISASCLPSGQRRP